MASVSMTDLQARLGPALAKRYAVERELGRGGMAVVYLARDLRHGRRVALKVLAPELAQAVGPERFLREIEIAARLSHPRILPLLESGAVDDLLFFVMPFVEGESLRARLDREKQLPVDDALDIARQVASGLAYAHDHGVVHRDIKPENLLLAGGEALILDFGIARAVTAAGGQRLTETGLTVGTPAYMSPEQASGEAKGDARSDVYALGCVLYEMLAGEPPFTGPSVQAITARKLSAATPNVTVLRESVPPALAEAVRKSLERVPADRYATAAQFADALRRSDRTGQPGSAPRIDGGGRWRERLLWLALGAGLALFGLSAAVGWLRTRAIEPAATVRMTGSLPPGTGVTRGPGYAASVALSPDGRTLVVAGTDALGQRLYRRTLDRLEVDPIAGTEGGSSPFFSPDGAWLGFFAGGRLRRVPVDGGAAVDITTVSGFPGGASWGPDDRIVFVSGGRAPVQVVNAHGGDAEPLIPFEAGEVSHVNPQLLPDGRTVLFESGGWIHALDLGSGRRTALVSGSAPGYAASGHLVLARGTTLLAAPFDASRLELTGPVVSLVEGVAHDGATGVAQYAISSTGVLAYVPGAHAHVLVLVDAAGEERTVSDVGLSFQNPQFSPDGRRLAVARSRATGEDYDIWIHDLDTETASRLTFEGGRAPVWTPDGAAVTYSQPGERSGIYTRAADGRGDVEQLLAIDEFHWLVGWTPEGRTLAFGVMEAATDDGVSRSSIMAFSGDEPHRTVGPGPAWGGRLSPDGLWLAYYSLESGRFEVYVTPFPGGGPRWLVSDDGGRDPIWAPDGAEVYYRSGDRLVAARIDTSAGVRVLARRLVMSPFTPPQYDDYDVHPDGRTMVWVRPREHSGREIVLVLDWFAELRRAAGR
jgi:eukaryotic-like serine/threonine-protein kinase